MMTDPLDHHHRSFWTKPHRFRRDTQMVVSELMVRKPGCASVSRNNGEQIQTTNKKGKAETRADVRWDYGLVISPVATKCLNDAVAPTIDGWHPSPLLLHPALN